MNELEQYKKRLQIALRAARICIFEVDLLRQRYTFFENAEAIFGVPGTVILKEVWPYQFLPAEEYRRAVSQYFSHPEDEEVIGEAFGSILGGEPAVYEARMRAGGSEFVWCRICVTPVMEDGQPTRMVGIITDISDERERRESLENAAHLDGLTGLYNKTYAMEQIQKFLQRDPRGSHALVVMDIDNFKNFNDQYGHVMGDAVISGTARRLRETFRRTDISGRFGGDEFLLFVEDIPDTGWLRRKFQEIVSFTWEGVPGSISAGAAFYPQDGTDFDTLFQKADAALYRAKAEKGKIAFWDEEQERDAGGTH